MKLIKLLALLVFAYPIIGLAESHEVPVYKDIPPGEVLYVHYTFSSEKQMLSCNTLSRWTGSSLVKWKYKNNLQSYKLSINEPFFLKGENNPMQSTRFHLADSQGEIAISNLSSSRQTIMCKYADWH